MFNENSIIKDVIKITSINYSDLHVVAELEMKIMPICINKLDVADEQYLQKLWCLPCLLSVNNKIYDRTTFINQIIYGGRYPLGFSNLHMGVCVLVPLFWANQSQAREFCPLLLHVKRFGVSPFDFILITILVSSIENSRFP